jgi:hypothetical protein
MNSNVLAAAVLLSVSSTAFAGFEVVDAPATLDDVKSAKRAEAKVATAPTTAAAASELAPVATHSAKAQALVSFQGTQKGNPKVIVGGAKNVRFADAVRQIVNFPGWHAFKDTSVDPDKKVSWRGGKPWPVVLEDVMKQAGTTAVVHWDNKTIHVSALAAHEEPVVIAGAGKKPAATKPAAPAKPKASAWEASPEDMTVRRVLEKWAEQAGWQKPFWYPESDYEISAFVRLEGSFEDALRSIAKNLNLEITLYRGNKIIVVRERG